MLAVPIKADCRVPNVRIQPDNYLEFGTCYLKHPEEMPITITNEDRDLMARYEIVAQDDTSKRIAVY